MVRTTEPSPDMLKVANILLTDWRVLRTDKDIWVDSTANPVYPLFEMIDPDCELCRQERRTEWYHLDHVCWIAECALCGIPMIIFNWHREPTASEIEYMKAVSETYYPGYGWRNERLIPNHWHKHILPVAHIHPAERYLV